MNFSDLEFFADNNIPVNVGFVTATEVEPSKKVAEFEEKLNQVVKSREAELSKQEDAFRNAVRDMLRNGVYKPTGRGKPASEYLIKAAKKKKFPRINTIVDINNYISLKYLVPASQWDLDQIGGQNYTLQLGKEGDYFEFNKSGQTIDIQDLVSVYAYNPDNGEWEPHLNPIKDSLKSKTGEGTRNVGAAVYLPAEQAEESEEWPTLKRVVDEYAYWLQQVSSGEVRTHYPNAV